MVERTRKALGNCLGSGNPLAIYDHLRTAPVGTELHGGLGGEMDAYIVLVGDTGNPSDRVLYVGSCGRLSYDYNLLWLQLKSPKELGLVPGRHCGSKKDELRPGSTEFRADCPELWAEVVRGIQYRVALVQHNPVQLVSYG
jgi:hypothetical protein